MSEPHNQFAAPWGTWVRVATVAATVLLLGIAILEAAVLPRGLLGGWPWLVGVAAPLSILAGSALFVVRGYALADGTLLVRRLLWSTRVPLDGLRAAWPSPEVMAGAIRLFGNGGLFSITGLFRSSALGRFRAYAMDPKRGVVLELPARKVVVTPDSPQRFLQELRRLAPAAAIADAEPAPGAPPIGAEAIHPR